MEGKKQVVGFIGIDKYEIILYLSRILKMLDKTVLISDCSVYGALDESIGYLKDTNKDTVVDYRGVDYVNSMMREHSLSYNEVCSKGRVELKGYDFIFLDFDFEHTSEALGCCDIVFIVTDMQKHNIRNSKIAASKANIPYCIIMKDVVECKVSLEYLLKGIQGERPADAVYVIYKDIFDEKYKIKCQYSDSIRFSGLSKSFKNMLLNIIKIISNEDDEKKIVKALKRAETGR